MTLPAQPQGPTCGSPRQGAWRIAYSGHATRRYTPTKAASESMGTSESTSRLNPELTERAGRDEATPQRQGR